MYPHSVDKVFLSMHSRMKLNRRPRAATGCAPLAWKISTRYFKQINVNKQVKDVRFRLSPPTESHPDREVNSLRHKPIDFSFTGFEDSCLGGLLVRGDVTSVMQDAMQVSGTSHYLM